MLVVVMAGLARAQCDDEVTKLKQLRCEFGPTFLFRCDVYIESLEIHKSFIY